MCEGNRGNRGCHRHDEQHAWTAPVVDAAHHQAAEPVHQHGQGEQHRNLGFSEQALRLGMKRQQRKRRDAAGQHGDGGDVLPQQRR